MALFLRKFLSARSEGAAKHFFLVDGYRKYGLYHDDLLGGYNNTMVPTVAEAYRRLMIDKPEMHDARVYRAIRATQLKIQKKFLPETEWTTFEEDQTKGRYLQPYLKQIEQEIQEKQSIEASLLQ